MGLLTKVRKPGAWTRRFMPGASGLCLLEEHRRGDCVIACMSVCVCTCTRARPPACQVQVGPSWGWVRL